MAEGSRNSDESNEVESNSALQNGVSCDDDNPEENEIVDINTIVQECSKEYADLDKTLDQLDNWMNTIEDQNDDLYSRIEELLESNRQIRKELQQQNSEKQEHNMEFGSDHRDEKMDEGEPKS